ncbi:LuxR C-terminal-related transcriptional regulator [Tsuneonella amylolytica]|uniref:LuxR C-terminal-related transcriptional regulator n=1 Tax=Tsuneonella amylolytica TaxID=2338327 RepID=UPI000EA863A9|nr:hypothetical protein [Tsuneonella amylolytica]
MPAVLDRELTDRQRAVLDGIDRRLPLKAVAAELGISESRVNQHVRTLKELYGVGSLPELVDAWRAGEGYSPPEPPPLPTAGPSRNPAWRTPEVPEASDVGQNEGRVQPGQFVLSDASFFAIEAPWTRDEPRVVPGALDGRNAIVLRLAVIIGLAFGILAAIVLVVTASLSLSEALKGKAAIPSDTSSPSG